MAGLYVETQQPAGPRTGLTNVQPLTEQTQFQTGPAPIAHVPGGPTPLTRVEPGGGPYAGADDLQGSRRSKRRARRKSKGKLKHRDAAVEINEGEGKWLIRQFADESIKVLRVPTKALENEGWVGYTVTQQKDPIWGDFVTEIGTFAAFRKGQRGEIVSKALEAFTTVSDTAGRAAGGGKGKKKKGGRGRGGGSTDTSGIPSWAKWTAGGVLTLGLLVGVGVLITRRRPTPKQLTG